MEPWTEHRIGDAEPDDERWLRKGPPINVVNAAGMDADTLYRHVRVRHPELCYGEKNPRPVAAPAKLRYLHAESHRLIPLVLDHFHDAESKVG